ncbi:DUF4179 domain-containing protein [Paenibacillus oleatilyticus]|uniref:DUF4179 domain-containing protein n=1 Tax=Paenibacillus oleatilyticus TaxID=2594886 RepID=UPI001C1F8ED3|nr:DUF4179 domain-containing protein [Paenibacillus oleatilyticus]MBU7318498.1 DUF4179 domain-containing protein [Paenibacillus oleatilyticus]
MKCLSRDEMEMFLTRSVVTNRSGIADHIATCSDCQRLEDALLEEQEQWAREMYAETLPESFTDQVMFALRDEEIEPVTPIPMTERVGRVTKKRRRKIWWVTVGVASILVLLGVASFYSIPTVAEIIRSLFSRNNVDIGLLRAQEFGLVQHPNIKVKDKGYTLKIDEAVADPTRVVVALQLFGPDGRHERERLRLLEERNGNRIVVKDEQGKVIGKLEDIRFTNDFYYLVAFFVQPIQSNRITIEGQIGIIDGDPWGKGFPAIKGNWNFEFPIDMTEAQKQTKITELQGEYTSPGGMTVRLKRLTRMVQGVRLELDTELSSEALARSPGDLWQKQELMFHFEDAAGSEIHSVNTRKHPSMNSLMTQSRIAGDKAGLMHLSYTFQYLPENQPYRFVFDGYYIAERDGSSVSFAPARLQEEPVFFRADGDDIRLKGFTIEQPPNTSSEETEGTLYVDGKLWNGDSFDDYWMARDSGGKEYRVSMGGSWSAGGSGWKDGMIQLSEDFEFQIPGMLAVPEKLTLIRNVVSKRYVNVDWSVEMNGSPENHNKEGLVGSIQQFGDLNLHVGRNEEAKGQRRKLSFLLYQTHSMWKPVGLLGGEEKPNAVLCFGELNLI